MEYAARLPQVPSRRKMLAPVLALIVGAGAATGVYALIDNNDPATQAAKVIVVEQPAPGSAEIPGKNESATAAAIAGSTSVTDIPGKNEAKTAAGISQSSGIELRGSKASAVSKPAFDAQSAAEEQRSDPHGPAAMLREPLSSQNVAPSPPATTQTGAPPPRRGACAFAIPVRVRSRHVTCGRAGR